MATNTERIADLERAAELRRVMDELRKADEDARVRLAVVEQQLADLRAARSLWGERGWAVILVLITALLGWIAGYATPR